MREDGMLDRSAIAPIAVAAMLAAAAPGAQAQGASTFPDWSGQWIRVPDGGVPRYDPTKPIRKQEAPLKPEYQARFEASMRDQDVGGQGLDLAYSCRPPGMPRMMSGVAPMEFLLSPGVTHILFDRNDYAPRRIYTDGRGWPKIGPDEATFPGYSIGKWIDKDGDGRYDELQIETRHVRNPRTWDQSGMPMADDDEGVIKERLFLDKDKPGVLHNEMTTSDGSLTRPWIVTKNYQRMKKVWWGENNCVEGQRWVTIGKEVYFLSGDDTIMPTRKGQPAPDLKYFEQQTKK
jgi:hypothetical protein